MNPNMNPITLFTIKIDADEQPIKEIFVGYNLEQMQKVRLQTADVMQFMNYGGEYKGDIYLSYPHKNTNYENMVRNLEEYDCIKYIDENGITSFRWIHKITQEQFKSKYGSFALTAPYNPNVRDNVTLYIRFLNYDVEQQKIIWVTVSHTLDKYREQYTIQIKQQQDGSVCSVIDYNGNDLF